MHDLYCPCGLPVSLFVAEQLQQQVIVGGCASMLAACTAQRAGSQQLVCSQPGFGPDTGFQSSACAHVCAV